MDNYKQEFGILLVLTGKGIFCRYDMLSAR